MNILFAILALGLLVALHEAGHFFVARWCGMRVHEFAIGFGPRIAHVKKGETEYSLRAIPLGGYVRVAGMHPSEEDADDPRGFLQSSAWKRFLMILAGPVANYATAAIFFLVVYSMWGVPDHGIKVGKLDKNSPAYAAGLRVGDSIRAVNGGGLEDEVPFAALDQLNLQIYRDLRMGKKVSVGILRGKKEYVLVFPKGKKRKKLSFAKTFPTIGLSIESHKIVIVKEVANGQWAEKAGLMPGDIVKSIDKKPVFDDYRFWRMFRKNLSKGSQVQVLRKGKLTLLSVAGLPSAAKVETALSFTTEQEKIVVTGVTKRSEAADARFEVGDQVTTIQGHPLRSVQGISSIQKLHSTLKGCDKNAIKLMVLRTSSKKDDWKPIVIPKGKDCGKSLVAQPTRWVLVDRVTKNSTAQKIGLQSGDKILTLEGQHIGRTEQLKKLLRMRIYRPLKLEIERQGKVIQKTVPVTDNPNQYLLGFVSERKMTYWKANFGTSFRYAVWQVWSWNVMIWDGLKRIVKGKEKANFTGPVGIVSYAKRAVDRSLRYFLVFIAIISIHLAFFNLLPIPALDGGRILFLFIQQISRAIGFKEESTTRVESFFHLIGFLLLFGVLILVTFKDILKLIF